jgi:enoyl-CoA hydratase/carnithine racemase
MAEQHVVGDKKGSIYYITLNRPDKRNALSPKMLIQISDMVETLVQDPEIRAVIVNGEGSVFSAGVGAVIRMDIHKFQQCFNRLESIEIPIICAMHGAVFGMAVELALTCDMRLISEDCTWGLRKPNLG